MDSATSLKTIYQLIGQTPLIANPDGISQADVTDPTTQPHPMVPKSGQISCK